MLAELIAGEMPSKVQLRRHWDKAKATMGLEDDDQFVFHVCRHTCATRLANADVDVLTIKTWLGHKRIETTQRYTHVKSSNLSRALHKRGNTPPLAA